MHVGRPPSRSAIWDIAVCDLVALPIYAVCGSIAVRHWDQDELYNYDG